MGVRLQRGACECSSNYKYGIQLKWLLASLVQTNHDPLEES